MSDFVGVFAAIAVVGFIALAMSIAWYIVGALFSYKLAKLKNVSYPWISWIPYISPYNYFEMMDGNEFKFWSGFQYDKKTIMIIYLLFPIIQVVLGNIHSGIGYIASIVYIVFAFFVYRNLYDSLHIKDGILYGIFSCIGLTPIMMILAHNNYKKYIENYNGPIDAEYKEIKAEEVDNASNTGEN